MEREKQKSTLAGGTGLEQSFGVLVKPAVNLGENIGLAVLIVSPTRDGVKLSDICNGDGVGLLLSAKSFADFLLLRAGLFSFLRLAGVLGLAGVNGSLLALLADAFVEEAIGFNLVVEIECSQLAEEISWNKSHK